MAESFNIGKSHKLISIEGDHRFTGLDLFSNIFSTTLGDTCAACLRRFVNQIANLLRITYVAAVGYMNNYIHPKTIKNLKGCW
ncbi:hypothetical protein SDC9_176259 [bioreactor metagenome]|uniref:Uncharacterized protein n=1 Tax=bioreactor metagenome TaxID=1076179 RepID=A0A645GXR0_9ZZZZ